METYEANLSEAERAKMIDDMVGYFDAENNEIDRRMFFEVTGRQII